MRLYGLLSSVRNIDKLGFRFAIIRVIEISALQDLPEIQNDFRPLRKKRSKRDITRIILSKVKHGFTGRCSDHLFDRHVFFFDNRQAVPGNRPSFRLSQDRSFVRIVNTFIKQLVDDFAVINTAAFNIRALIQPVRIRSDHSFRPVTIGKSYFCQKHEFTSEIVFRMTQAEFSFIPPVSQRYFDQIIFPDLIGNIIGLILNLRMIVAVIRCQYLAADLTAV